MHDLELHFASMVLYAWLILCNIHPMFSVLYFAYQVGDFVDAQDTALKWYEGVVR